MDVSGWTASLVIGALMLPFPICASVIVRSVYRRRVWSRAEGTVTSSKKLHKKREDSNYVTRFRFTDAAGRRYTGREITFFEKKQGRELKVMYNPDDPNESVLFDLTWLYVMLAITGSLFALAVALIVDRFN